MDAADQAQIDIFRRWIAKPFREREADRLRYRTQDIYQAWRRRVASGAETLKDAVGCGYCLRLLPKALFNPCEWNKPEGRTRYCAECRSGRGRKARLLAAKNASAVVA